ncbi:hypothetical protein CJ030_MR5G025039 [Morella rubra]|uniref:Uncharacterized protein n=1 Tax=Morella rubra TaxID=262757 RepID=A0A6A1VHN6_9ROSI|nr:hypothetical protein CJ030_MR5G025039 [Morella rubra]
MLSNTHFSCVSRYLSPASLPQARSSQIRAVPPLQYLRCGRYIHRQQHRKPFLSLSSAATPTPPVARMVTFVDRLKTKGYFVESLRLRRPNKRVAPTSVPEMRRPLQRHESGQGRLSKLRS